MVCSTQTATYCLSMVQKYHGLFVVIVTIVLLVLIVITTVWDSKPFTPVNLTTLPAPIDLSLTRTESRMSRDLKIPWYYNGPQIEKSLKKVGHSITDLPPWSALWTDKIHLCIMFNLNKVKPKPNVIDILITYYHPFFRNITLIFDGTNLKKPNSVPKFVNFITCDSHIGWYQHKCIRSCIQQGNEETKGYLYIADDMFINLTMMASLPRTKIWFPYMTPKNYSWILDPGPKGWDWGWWGPPANGAKNLELVINRLPVEWIEQLRRSAGFPGHFKSKAISDIIFIPQTLQYNMTKVLDFIINNSTKDQGLFGEIATCLAVNIVTSVHVTFRYGYIWKWDRKNTDAIEKIARSAHFVHPLKLGISKYAKLWIKYMEQQLYSAIHE